MKPFVINLADVTGVEHIESNVKQVQRQAGHHHAYSETEV